MESTYKLRIKNSQINIKKDKRFLLSFPCKHLLDCSIEETEDESIFIFDLSEQSKFSEALDLKLKDKYRLLYNVAELNTISDRYIVDISPDNLVYDVNLIPSLLFRDKTRANEEDSFLPRYKALVAYVLKPNLGFEDYYVGGNEFYIKAGTVDLKEGEIQTAIIIPKKAYEGYKGHYIKYAMREAMDIATTGCSVNVKLSEDKKSFEDVRIAYGVAGPIPMRVPSAENFIRGKEVNEENIEAFAQKVLEDINPRDSWRASKAFRCHIGVVMARKACEKAVKQAGGKVDDRTEL